MTDREKAIITAYTGITMLTGEKFNIFHKYIEDILGRPIWTHELASSDVWEEIKEKSKPDFIKLCHDESEAEQGEWIPIKIRELTEEEKEEYPDSTFMYDCPLPEDGEEVLVTTFAGNVTLDTFYRDDGCYFESYCDADDVLAWMPLPKPYKKGGAE